MSVADDGRLTFVIQVGTDPTCRHEDAYGSLFVLPPEGGEKRAVCLGCDAVKTYLAGTADRPSEADTSRITWLRDRRIP